MTTSLAREVREVVDRDVEHLNADHPDTVLFLARHALGVDDAVDAEIVGVDTCGADIEVRGPDGSSRSTRRLAFDEPVATATDVQTRLLTLLTTSREQVGDAVPLTSTERELATRAALPTMPVEVVAARTLTPKLREVVLGGELTQFVSHGLDQFVYVFAPRPEAAGVPDDYSMAQFMATTVDERPWGAYYTVRAWDPDRREITMWMVVHGHADGVGGWAARCSPGDRVSIWGPRTLRPDPDGAAHHVLVADESAFAAVATRLEELPDGVSATVIAETVDADHRIELRPAHRSDVAVHWIDRGTAEPGVGDALLDAVIGLELDGADPARHVVVGGGESRQMSSIRRYLRRELGLPATHVSMTGYWRR